MQVKQTEGTPEIPAEVLARHIEVIADAIRAMNATRLKKETIIVLLHDYTRIAKRDIKCVLDGLEVLESAYLKPKEKKK